MASASIRTASAEVGGQYLIAAVTIAGTPSERSFACSLSFRDKVIGTRGDEPPMEEYIGMADFALTIAVTAPKAGWAILIQLGNLIMSGSESNPLRKGSTSSTLLGPPICKRTTPGLLPAR